MQKTQLISLIFGAVVVVGGAVGLLVYQNGETPDTEQTAQKDASSGDGQAADVTASGDTDGSQAESGEEQLAEAQGQLAEAKEQAKAYVKQLVTRHKADIDEMRVKQTELQEEVDNLRANAEAHNLEMNAKDNSLHEVRERLNAALQVRALAHELARPHACMGIRK